jgi:hypothetical protein
MPQLELADETWIAAPVADVARAVAQPSRQRDWWPDAPLDVSAERGLEGVRWVIGSGAAVVGTVEIWLQPSAGGVRLHYLVGVGPAGSAWSARRLRAQRDRIHRHTKRVFWALKDELESSVRAGGAPETGRVTYRA